MQNPAFLKRCIDELRQRFVDVEIIEGDRYHPVHGVRCRNFHLPLGTMHEAVTGHDPKPNVCDLVVPMPRCSGYFPDASILGVHLSRPVYVTFGSENSMIPFCSTMTTDQLQKFDGYYPLYEAPERLPEEYFVCLTNEERPAITPCETICHFESYVRSYLDHCEFIAKTQLAKLGTDEAASAERWLGHLTTGIAPGLRRHLVGTWERAA